MGEKAEIQKKNLSIRETALVYGVSESWLYKQSAKRKLPLLKVGSRVLIPIADFEAWLALHKVNGGEK